MTYADFTYYRYEYMGAGIEEPDFSRLAMRASRFLDYYTQGRATANAELDAVKMACCALAEQYQLIDSVRTAQAKGLAASVENAGKELQSETVGPWSKTYKSGGDSAASMQSMSAELNASLAQIARQYLSGTGMLYRGKGCKTCSHIL